MPRPRTTPDEWARANIVYPEDAPVPGAREPLLTPYMVPVIRAVHGRTHKKVVFASGAQQGKTASALDLIGERFDTSPVPTLYTGPNKQFLNEQLEPRIMDLLDNTPLRHKVARGKKNKKFRKIISGVFLRLAHGGSPTAMKSDSIGLAITDEVDDLMANVRKQGDPVSLIDRRGANYDDFVHYLTSTPSLGASEIEMDPDSGLEFWARVDPDTLESTIWRLYQEGTRHHWAWPCPHCGEFFIPRFKDLRWERPTLPSGKPGPSNPLVALRTERCSRDKTDGSAAPRCRVSAIIDDQCAGAFSHHQCHRA